jgi:hypothetical protein
MEMAAGESRLSRHVEPYELAYVCIQKTQTQPGIRMPIEIARNEVRAVKAKQE